MGFFAVVHPRSNDKAFSVKRCHLNFFAIRPSPGQGLSFLWDVGLLLANETNGREDREVEFSLVIPFKTSRDSFSDLGSLLLEQKIAANIFGEPVTIDHEKCITLRSLKVPESQGVNSDGKFRVFQLASDSAKYDEDKSGLDASVWRFKVDFSGGLDTYIRMRFKLESPGRLMQTLYRDSSGEGALVDFRVSDVRGADTKGAWDSLEGKMAEIETLNFFLITPVDFRMLAASPELKYTRLLEANVWKGYLRTETPEPLVAYHWNKTNSISTEKPFHVFARISAYRQALSRRDFVLVGLVGIVSSCASMAIMGARPPWLVRLVSLWRTLWGKVLALLFACATAAGYWGPLVDTGGKIVRLLVDKIKAARAFVRKK